MILLLSPMFIGHSVANKAIFLVYRSVLVHEIGALQIDFIMYTRMNNGLSGTTFSSFWGVWPPVRLFFGPLE